MTDLETTIDDAVKKAVEEAKKPVARKEIFDFTLLPVPQLGEEWVAIKKEVLEEALSWSFRTGIKSTQKGVTDD